MTIVGLRYHDDGTHYDNTGQMAPGCPLPPDLRPVHNFANAVQFQGLGFAMTTTVPAGPNVDMVFLTEIHAWLQAMAPDVAVCTVGASGRDITCVLVSEAKLKRCAQAFHFTSAGGSVCQFDVRALPVKQRSECIVACVQHALAGGLSISNVCAQLTSASFREAYEEAKTVAAEESVAQAMLRLEAHAGHKYPLLKRRQLMDELSGIAKRARFELRPVPSPIIAAGLLLGWQQKVLTRLGANLEAPRRTLLWIYSTGGNAGKSSFTDHLVATFRWGVFQASSKSDQHGVGNRYAEEGLIIFDIAKNARFTTSLLELIELVSNTGSKLTTEKYKGSEPTLRASVLVFGNRPCPQALRHRAVYQLMIPGVAPGEQVCDGTGTAACGCVYHARLRADMVTDFTRVF